MRVMLVLIPFAFLLSACGSFGGQYKAVDVENYDEQGNRIASPTAQEFEKGVIKAFPDIPMPSGYKIDLERSVIFSSPSQSMGKVRMVGGGDADSLYRFFEKEMPANGWTIVNAFQSETSSLYFAKPGRFVAVIIESGKRESVITLNVGPE